MNISIIGGDSRIVELIKLLKLNEKNEIGLYGMENLNDFQNLKKYKTLNDAIENSEEIITAIPISKDGLTISSPYSATQISVDELFNLAKNKKIITGNITKEISNKINVENNNNIIDILKNEELTILNSIPTAEGAIQIAMEKSKITLHNSKCLVMGFGRIGKVLSKMLKGIGAQVYCEARKTTDLAFINAYGYNAVELEKITKYLSEFDFIFNTIPYIVLDEIKLNCVNKNCLIIDLASKPGGVDFEYAKKIGIHVEWCLALPRKSCAKNFG